MVVDQNLVLFRELLQCGADIPLWCYDENGQLLESNSPDESLLETAFSVFGCKERMLAYAKEQDNPAMIGTAMGLVWAAVFEKAGGKLIRAHVIGPVFYSDISVKAVEQGFRAYSGVELSIAWKMRFVEGLRRIPVVNNILFSRYTMMLHYCVTGQHIYSSDLSLSAVGANDASPVESTGKTDRHKVWGMEQSLLQMVRNGDLGYSRALEDSSGISSGVPVRSEIPLLSARISNIVFISLVCRAAIEGGLSPEEGYSLGDFYIQSTVDAKTYDELSSIPIAMYDDFIRRVRKCRTNPHYSKPVQKCIDYIETHLGEKIMAADLAGHAGYSEYYITHKFREETGTSINDYIKFAKMERAKILLIGTGLSMQEISDQLGFSTRSYFSACFRQVTGRSPTEYREVKSR